MIEVMTTPFRHNKKERKRLRGRAKKWVIAADKLEKEGTRPDAVAVLRGIADHSSGMALAKQVTEKHKES